MKTTEAALLLELATKLAAEGITCYWSDIPRYRTYAHIGDDTGVCYVQVNYGTLQLHSVHVPNSTSGTGYQLHDNLSIDSLTPERVRDAMQIKVPSWHPGDEIPKKYRSIEDYISQQLYPDTKISVPKKIPLY